MLSQLHGWRAICDMDAVAGPFTGQPSPVRVRDRLTPSVSTFSMFTGTLAVPVAGVVVDKYVVDTRG